MRRVLTSVAVAVVAAGLAAGCDGDEADPKADFLERADRICLYSGLRPKGIPNDARQAAALLAEEARLRAGVHRRLSALEPPGEVERDYALFLRRTEQVADALRRMSAVARRDEPARLAELGRRATLVENERMRVAERIGFRRCGRAITAPVREPSR
jgi:hypothetical protein